MATDDRVEKAREKVRYYHTNRFESKQVREAIYAMNGCIEAYNELSDRVDHLEKTLEELLLAHAEYNINELEGNTQPNPAFLGVWDATSKAEEILYRPDDYDVAEDMADTPPTKEEYATALRKALEWEENSSEFEDNSS